MLNTLAIQTANGQGSERFKHTTRPYKVEDVVKLQGEMLEMTGDTVDGNQKSCLANHGQTTTVWMYP